MEQAPLLNRRITTRLCGDPVGKDIDFRCFTADGGPYFCKSDKDLRSIRATEYIATGLARHVGIAVADFAIIEDNDLQTYFGSRSPESLASDREIERLLNNPAKNEIGQPSAWPGQYLASLTAFDMFIDNPDRCIRNFVLDRSTAPARLCAIDFASARFIDCTVDRFPVESDPTVWVGKFWDTVHGRHVESAVEMLDRLIAVPVSILDQIMRPMPDDWLDPDQREGLRKFWEDGRRLDRISRLRALSYESHI
jgi:hypothetical protein